MEPRDRGDRGRPARAWILLAIPWALAPPRAAAGAAVESPSAELRALVEEDWHRQETGRGRTPAAPAAIRDALGRGERLLRTMRATPEAPALDDLEASLGSLRTRAGASLSSLPERARAELYREVRWTVRELALRNPLLGSRPIVFLKRRRFVCQMLHEYLGYYYDYEDIEGGGVFRLERPGRSLETRDLVRSRLPPGNYTTLALSFDARSIWFAFAPRASEKPDYYSAERRSFHLYRLDTDGGGLRQVTRGAADDFDPCPLPDGGVAFMSTRRGGFGRCHNPWEPLPAYTLHRVEADGSGLRTLSFHETNEWHPSVLPDGRIVYSRWDYVDRSAANFHGLWISRPDGTGAESLFGNYTRRINACYQARAIPGSRRIVFVAGAHHADVGGSLVVVDPTRVALDAASGEDRFDSIEVLTPEVCFPEAPGWPSSWYHSPWPLSEDVFLVAFCHDPLPGMGPGVKEDSRTGLYLFDRFGNLELLYRTAEMSSMYPVPLVPRPTPPVVSGESDPELAARDEGLLFLHDVTRSLLRLPPDRPVRELRVFQVLPKSETHVANRPRLGYANAESARLLLGTVPVEPDGSACFRAPARRPLYFQAVDAEGRAVQTMRSVLYLQPGERRSCVGCHEPPGTAAPPGRRLALDRPPSSIRPGPDGSRPWSFPRLVQPILDRRCVSCHGDGHRAEDIAPPLTGEPRGEFTASYLALRDHVRWFEWGGATIDPIVTRPGRLPSSVSPLARILEDRHHADRTGLTDAERRTLWLWLDGNAAFYGAYDESRRLAQRGGAAVTVPELE